MVLPHPILTPAEHEPTQVMALSEDAAENVNAGPLSTFPATTSHNVEPQQATPALGPRYASMSHIPWVADIDLFCIREQRFTGAFTVWALDITSADTPEVSPVFSSVNLGCGVRGWDNMKSWLPIAKALSPSPEHLVSFLAFQLLFTFPRCLFTFLIVVAKR